MKSLVPKLPSLRFVGAALALMGSLSLPLQAATVTYQTSAPEPDADDVYNFSAGATDGENIGSGADAQTYLALDRGTQGQTFMTGNHPAGYVFSGFWVRQVAYSAASGNGSYWSTNNAGAVIATRVTDPAQIGAAGFTKLQESYTVTATEANNPGTGGGTGGLGFWVHVNFAAPVILAPNTLYGFDVTVTTTSPN